MSKRKTRLVRIVLMNDATEERVFETDGIPVNKNSTKPLRDLLAKALFQLNGHCMRLDLRLANGDCTEITLANDELTEVLGRERGRKKPLRRMARLVLAKLKEKLKSPEPQTAA